MRLSNPTAPRISRLPYPWRPGLALWRGLAALGLLLALWAGYRLTGQPITLVINGQAYPLRTHRLEVAAIIQAAGLTLQPEDRIQPSLNSRLAPGETITLQLARPVSIEVDRHTWHLLTHRKTVAAVLAEAGLISNARDQILINGVSVPADAPLPPATDQPAVLKNITDLLAAIHTPQGAIASGRPEPVQLIIRRAVPITLNDGQVSSTFYTTQLNVGEALLEQGLTLFLGDEVTPRLSTRLSPGMQIYIQRSQPVAVTVDGRLIKTRTRRDTVGEVLAQEEVVLMGQDFSRPPTNQPLTAGETIEVIRVREALEIEVEFIPFETEWLPDDNMEIDQQEIRQQGVTGMIKSRTRVRFENEQEMARVLEDKWLDQEPNKQIIAYGTNIVIRTVETPAGPLEYWRKISMLTTPYNAATSGKSADHPQYGITRTGLRVSYGMAAVDPKVIPLLSQIYVSGYGVAVAADTGGLIVGKHIDLAYNDNQPMPDLYGWHDVYILTPMPPADKIRYVLPQWPPQ
jgi:resuscitation-promoting factor RpfB